MYPWMLYLERTWGKYEGLRKDDGTDPSFFLVGNSIELSGQISATNCDKLSLN
jgi:hypothetical protein